MNKISVIIPAYNAEKTIEKCLESVYAAIHTVKLSDNSKECEVIVVDDCSTDNTVEIIKDSPSKVIRFDKHLGVSTARNTGAKQCSGGIILFLDSDVIFIEDGLKELNESFEKYPDTDVIQGVYTKDTTFQNPSALSRNYYKYYQTSKITGDYISGINSCCFAIKKKVFESVKGFDPAWERVEDVELGWRLVKNGYKILLNKRLQVKHNKYYSFIGLLKADFKKVYAKMKLLLSTYFQRDASRKGEKQAQAKITFSLNKMKDMLAEFSSVFLSGLIIMEIIGLAISRNFFFYYLIPVSAAIFILLNLNFLILIKRDKGLMVTIKCLFVYYFEMLIAQFAILKAIYDYSLKRYYKKGFFRV
ncbi:MAG: glycosyltransferase family 2 protein [Candidatus Omnitrophica bacterium]|nr:glycosyltransferase family 2 protein [Candidatus Omnitrophota bacterium]